MPFTYKPENLDTHLISQIRLEIGDEVEGEGVFPDGSNIADEEIQYFIDKFSNDIQLTLASICRMLSTRYARLSDITVGGRKENLSQISKSFALRSKDYMVQTGAGSAGVVRVDGFSDNRPADDSGLTTSEYDQNEYS